MGQQMMKCSKCGAEDLDLSEFQSMMLVSKDEALFTMECPHCGTTVSSMQPIPFSLRDKVEAAAGELDAGMGRDI